MMTKVDLIRPILHLYGAISLLLVVLLLAQLSYGQPDTQFNRRYPPFPQQDSQPARESPTSQDGLQRVSPPTAIIIAVLVTAFFLMALFSLCLRKCAGESAGSLRRIGTLGRSRRTAASRGLDRATIDSFPILQYSVVKGLKLGKSTLECAVCLNEFQDEETLRLLPKCNHVFHPDCVDIWLATHTTCPVCRCSLVPGTSDTDSPETSLPDTETATQTVSRDVEMLDQVAIDVPDESEGQISNHDRPIRSKSARRSFRFPRSHTTGHSVSVIQVGTDFERFTLRLPETVRKEIFDGKLSRTGSSGSVPAEGRSFQFGRFDRKAKSERWGFSLAPPFFVRAPSLRSVKSIDGNQTATAKVPFPPVKTPLDCLGGKEESTAEQAAARASAPVFTVSGE